MVEYKPISSLTDDLSIEFVIFGIGDDYLDFSKTMLCLQVSIKQKIGTTEIAKGKKAMSMNVGLVNNFMHFSSQSAINSIEE